MSADFIHERNCVFFMLLGKEKSLKWASQEAKLSYKHALFLVKEWVRKGYLVREPTKKGRYIYTAEGLELLMVVEDIIGVFSHE